MDVIESTWKVRLILSSGSVLDGVYIGKMSDRDDDVCQALLGVSLPRSRFDPSSAYNSIFTDENGMTRVFFRVGDVSALEISPLP